MSGIDEQPIKDIPVCPECGKRPNFWILYSTMAQNSTRGWYWLFSDDYLERNTHNKLERHEGRYGGSLTLDDVVCITCSRSGEHVFVRNQPVFQQVITCARRLSK